MRKSEIIRSLNAGEKAGVLCAREEYADGETLANDVLFDLAEEALDELLENGNSTDAIAGGKYFDLAFTYAFVREYLRRC